MTTSEWDKADCTPWCTGTGHNHDPACWGPDRYVHLRLEEGFPHEALPDQLDRFDPPRIGAHSYRSQPGYRSVVYLHLYRPHDTERRDLDDNLKLTADEAISLAEYLLAVAREIGGAA